MADIKTKKNNASVEEFIESLDNRRRKDDAKKLLSLYEEVLKLEPSMWGDSIIGYGQYHYKSERSRQEGDWPLAGFSPRKQSMTLYIMTGIQKYENLFEKLGKHKRSLSCLYINKLEDVDTEILKEIIKISYEDAKKLLVDSKNSKE